MKKIKQTIKNTCIALGMLFIFQNAFSQYSETVNVSSGNATVYMCIGSTYIFTFTGMPSNDSVQAMGSEYTWYLTPTCVNYGENQVSLCLLTTDYNAATIKATNYVNGSTWSFIVNFYPYLTNVNGPASVCKGSAETYTCTTDVPGVATNNYTWGPIPSFLSGSSTTDLLPTLATNTGHSNLCVTVWSGSGAGCPVGSLSNTGCLDVASVSGPPPAPCCLQFIQAGDKACWCDSVTWGPIIGATEYEWSYNSSFVPYYTTTVAGIYGYFPYSNCFSHRYYTYTYYVRAKNVCGLFSPIARLTATTPCKPFHCLPVREDEVTGDDSDDNTDIAPYMVYPNPANTQLIVEYPSSGILNQTLTIFDLLGKKLASYELPASGDKITLNVSNLPVGMFVYFISSGDDVLQRGKIMIQR